MDKQTKTNVKNLVLSLRDDFEKEIENRLSHIGIYKDREWKDGRSLPHLAEDELGRKELDKRRRVAAFIKREEKLGLSIEEATSEFIKECSYTWINRLLGLKCMECQGIIEEVITTRPEFSNRSRVHRDFRETHPDIASKADDGLTATLFLVFGEVTDEIKILFDPSNEYSLIIPRYALLKKSIEKINTELDYETYRADDFLGWVYQYFNSREKERVFEEVNTKKKKISGTDIINVTQLYTEKYMVHFLVENSLGAMWTEMYPDSHLSSKWEYFVKDKNNSTHEHKPVKEITFLDPACGSGHFLLYAFDLYYDMYLEEGVIPREQIPDHILKYNLHGIDIDLRAIQLTALGLYMKAKSKNPDVKVHHMNLVSADAIMQDKEILEEFLQEFEGDQTAQKLIRTIWEGLENVRELGSLLKVEEQIDAVIEQKKDKRLDFYEDNIQKNWDQWKQAILNSIKRYYEEASLSFDLNKQMFANEAYKGVQLLDLLEQKYDVVATNPPYAGKRNLDQNFKKIFSPLYKNYDGDLYSAFIKKSSNLCQIEGKVGMVSQHTFLYLSTYTKLREDILDNSEIKNVAHLGSGAFNEISGEKVNTALIVINNHKHKNNLSIFFNLSKFSNKEVILKEIVSNKGKFNENIFILNQNEFRSVKGNPFTYSLSPLIRSFFKKYPKYEKYSTPLAGSTTGDNDLFLRYFWEIQNPNSKDWPLYAKGNSDKYYNTIDTCINWQNEGEKIRNFSKSTIASESYFYNEGINFNIICQNFDARYMPKNCIFDHAVVSIFENKKDMNYDLGWINSTLFSYLLYLINPTVNHLPGDVKKIPYSIPNVETEHRISVLVKECINIKKSKCTFAPISLDFKVPAIRWGYTNKGD